MSRFQLVLTATALSLFFVTVAHGGTITGSRMGASGTRAGTITGSRVGTITGSRVGTITGSRTEIVATIRSERGRTISQVESEFVSQFMFSLLHLLW